MAMGVVERLEMVGVDHQERDRGAVAHGAPPFAFDDRIEFAPVAQAGQRVGRGHLLEQVFGLRPPADLAGEEQGADHEGDQRQHDRADLDRVVRHSAKMLCSGFPTTTNSGLVLLRRT